jgi:hypothetical protein
VTNTGLTQLLFACPAPPEAGREMLAPVVVESEARGVPYEAVAGGVDAAELEPLKKSTIEPLGRVEEWGGQ